MTLKVGDKVAVYSVELGRGIGTITSIEFVPPNWVTVKFFDKKIKAHPKQCRKIKKNRRRVWIKITEEVTPSGVDFKGNVWGPWITRYEISSQKISDEWVEFIEIKKK